MNRYFTKRRAKKAQPEPKVEVNIENALPAADDFRTSLIMSSLSKRFSMLKEQDDPFSKLGKASDDSVLGPRRQSRLMDFGYSGGRGLADIAEVSSIHGEFRPPFADTRQNSFYSDGYATDDDSVASGSIMSRARPGEGNILFGGRQKIYKIPLAGAASSSSLGGSSGMKGRALYDDDVSLSTFQRWRQEERDRLGRDSDFQDTQDPTSPSIGSITRKASTSTSNTTGRASTAATSINSQSGIVSSSNTPNINNTAAPFSYSPAPERAGQKTRRLYDFGLNKEIEDQQSTALTRLNSIQAPRGRTPPPPFSRVASRHGGNDAMRSPSPVTIKPSSTRSNTSYNSQKAPELPSPLEQFKNSPLMSALDPNDRGKATALGAFNKPSQFSEEQYLERQAALRYAQESPQPETESRLEDNSSIAESKSDKPSSYASSNHSIASTNAPENVKPPAAFSVFHNAAKNIRANQKETEGKVDSFYNRSSDGSSYEDDLPRSKSQSQSQSQSQPQPVRQPRAENLAQRLRGNSSIAKPPAHEHPAFKSLSKTELDSTSSSNKSLFSEFDFSQDSHHNRSDTSLTSSKTNNGAGLGGLVRQHLRHGSNASSFYDQSRSSMTDYNAAAHPVPISSNLKTLDENTQVHAPSIPNPAELMTNPFEFEFDDNGNIDDGRNSPVSDVEEDDPSIYEASPQGVKAARRRGISQAQDLAGNMSWDREGKPCHVRGASAETIQEQDALTNEVAKRSKIIQQKLEARRKEREQSVTSTVLDDRSSSGPFRGLDVLRTKSSRESFKKASDSFATSRTGRALGLGSERPSIDRLRSEESLGNGYQRSRSNSRAPASRSNSRPGTRGNNSKLSTWDDMPQLPENGRTSEESTSSRKSSNIPHYTALNNMTKPRSRSNSGQSGGRSRSRNGRFRDDTDSSSTYNEPESIPEHPTQKHETVEQHLPRLQIQTGRFNNTNSYLGKDLYPPQQIHSPLSASSTASSPRFGNSSNSPMGMRNPMFPISPVVGVPIIQGAPGAFMNRAHLATPPVSGNSTPVGGQFPTNTLANSFVHGRPDSRKKMVNKAEIGEPRLISTSFVVDTVSLPPGASLKNGMADSQSSQHSAPALPSLNPLRRKFNLGRSSEDQDQNVLTFKSSPYEPLVSGSPPRNVKTLPPKSQHRLRKSSSEGEKIGMRFGLGQPSNNFAVGGRTSDSNMF